MSVCCKTNLFFTRLLVKTICDRLRKLSPARYYIKFDSLSVTPQSTVNLGQTTNLNMNNQIVDRSRIQCNQFGAFLNSGLRKGIELATQGIGTDITRAHEHDQFIQSLADRINQQNPAVRHDIVAGALAFPYKEPHAQCNDTIKSLQAKVADLEWRLGYISFYSNLYGSHVTSWGSQASPNTQTQYWATGQETMLHNPQLQRKQISPTTGQFFFPGDMNNQQTFAGNQLPNSQPPAPAGGLEPRPPQLIKKPAAKKSQHQEQSVLLGKRSGTNLEENIPAKVVRRDPNTPHSEQNNNVLRQTGHQLPSQPLPPQYSGGAMATAKTYESETKFSNELIAVRDRATGMVQLKQEPFPQNVSVKQEDMKPQPLNLSGVKSLGVPGNHVPVLIIKRIPNNVAEKYMEIDVVGTDNPVEKEAKETDSTSASADAPSAP